MQTLMHREELYYPLCIDIKAACSRSSSSISLLTVHFEFVGVSVIIISGLKGFYYYIRRRPDMKLTLAQGLAVGLEFKLCSEILKTVIVRDFKEIATVAGIIALRAALTFLIHWEIKQENHNHSQSGF